MFAHRGRNRVDAFGPAFAAMAGDQDLRQRPLPDGGSRQIGKHRHKRIYAAVAGEMDSAGDTLAEQIRRREMGRREQQVGEQVDLDSIFFLRPGQRRIVGAQPGFDVGERDHGRGGGARRAERARRIALDDQQIGTIGEERPQCRCNLFDMRVRVGFTRTIEGDRAIARESMLRRIERRVLAGENQRRLEPALAKSVGDGS